MTLLYGMQFIIEYCQLFLDIKNNKNIIKLKCSTLTAASSRVISFFAEGSYRRTIAVQNTTNSIEAS